MRTDPPSGFAISISGEYPRVVFHGFRDRRHARAFAEELEEILLSSGYGGDAWLAAILITRNPPQGEIQVEVLINPDLPEETCVAIIDLLIDPVIAEYIEDSIFEDDEWIVGYTSVGKVRTRTGVLEEMNLLVAFGAWTWNLLSIAPVAPSATHEEIAEGLRRLLSGVRRRHLPKRILTKNSPPFFIDGRSTIQPVLDEYGIEHGMCGGKRRRALRKILRYFRKWMMKNLNFRKTGIPAFKESKSAKLTASRLGAKIDA